MENDVNVKVQAEYIEEQSRPENQQLVFAYTIRIENHGQENVQLLTRYWEIKESTGSTQVVEGEGVVGEQPTLAPGESYTYTSGAVIQSPPGTMHGHYTFESKDNGKQFEVEIPMFVLALPQTLH